jgi:hypothetical protein
MYRNEEFLKRYSTDSTRQSHHHQPVVLSKRGRNEGEGEEAVIQHMVKRLRVDDDSKPPSPVPMFPQHEQQQPQQQQRYYQTQAPQHIHQQHYQQQQQQQYQQHFANQHHQYLIPPVPMYSTQQSYQSHLAPSSTEILTPKGRRQQQFRRQQEFQQEQQHLQVNPGDDESEELSFVSPMNKLLGSLHQQRRVATSWQREERLLLPTNTQLF